MDWAQPHIGQYPPRFSSSEQKEDILRATRLVTTEIKALDAKNIKDPNLLVDLGWVLAMAHNLDINTGDLAKEYFERGLAIDKDSARGNYLMGMFLASTSKYHLDSIPYLEKALKLGKEDAGFTLGLLFVQQGKKTEGMRYLQTYSEKHPENQHVKRVIKGIGDGSLQFGSTAPLQHVASDGDLSLFTQTYYLSPRPDLVTEAIKYIATNKTLSGPNGESAKPPLIIFFSKVFSDNPSLVKGWKGIVDSQDGEARAVFTKALTTPPDQIINETPNSPQRNDMYWAAFFASGDVSYVNLIIAQLKGLDERKDMNRYLTAASAKWSLASNARMHGKVRTTVELAGKGDDPKIRQAATDILAMTPQQINNNVQAVLKEQKKKGVW